LTIAENDKILSLFYFIKSGSVYTKMMFVSLFARNNQQSDSFTLFDNLMEGTDFFSLDFKSKKHSNL